jgi:hypothetical protein
MVKWVEIHKKNKNADRVILKYINEHRKQILKKTYGAKIRMTEQLTKGEEIKEPL